MKLIFATGNANKVKEVKAQIGELYNIVSLKDIGFLEDIPEPHPTLEDNALEKARVIHQKFQTNCFSEDTGLEIAALNGAPGVLSARYAGSDRNAQANMALALKNLRGQANRKAQFRTVIALILKDVEYLFEGVVTGQIIEAPMGKGGFGYDPIFQPDGYTQTFGELPNSTKYAISHRAKAVEKLVAFLKKQASE